MHKQSRRTVSNASKNSSPTATATSNVINGEPWLIDEQKDKDHQQDNHLVLVKKALDRYMVGVHTFQPEGPAMYIPGGSRAARSSHNPQAA